MRDYKSKLEPDRFYHIYNRANGSELLFRNPENYKFFLRRYKKYITPIVHTYAYCLLPNHFHMLVRVKSEMELLEIYERKLMGQHTNLRDSSKNLGDFSNLQGFIARQFSNFFNSYAKAYNKQYNRMGSLFIHAYSRISISSQTQLKNTLLYIHRNAMEAKLATSMDGWEFSSYGELVSKSDTWLSRPECIKILEDLENFIEVHKRGRGSRNGLLS